MFKIFEKDGKINFVDDKNVLVGFDYQQSCCESFGYFISELEPVNVETINFDHEPIGGDYNVINCSEFDFSGYNFDTNYYSGGVGNDSVIFKITNNEKPLYLCLYNHHNGYYGHGFHMEHSGKIIASGVL
jgi:hypothetical protein